MDRGVGEQGGELVSDRQTRFGGSENFGLDGGEGSDRPCHFRELLSDNRDLGGELRGEFERDLTGRAEGNMNSGIGGETGFNLPSH